MGRKKQAKKVVKRLLELDGTKKGDPDYEKLYVAAMNSLLFHFKRRFKYFFEDIAIFIIVCLAIIFRPLNLLIGGLIFIIILLAT